MTMNPMYARMGLSIGQGVTGFVNQGIASNLASNLQKYRNQMLQITAAMTNNTITLNEIATRDAATRAAFDIEKATAKDQGAAAVSAAAAGVQGLSVDRAMRGLRRSALFAHAARKQKMSSELRAYNQERINTNVGAILGRDITVQSKPSALSSIAGLGSTLLRDFNNSQPEGDKLGDQIKRWWEQ